MYRWVLGGIVCLIAGGWMLKDALASAPALDQLTEVTGEVTVAEVETQKTRRMQSTLLKLQVGEKSAAYYSDRFPDFEKIVASIKPGDKISIWVDVGKNNYVWQIEKGKERLVSYDQVANIEGSKKSGNTLLAILFIVFGVGILVLMAWRATHNQVIDAAEKPADGANPTPTSPQETD